MHVQSCCLANQTLSLFWRFRRHRRWRCLSSLLERFKHCHLQNEAKCKTFLVEMPFYQESITLLGFAALVWATTILKIGRRKPRDRNTWKLLSPAYGLLVLSITSHFASLWNRGLGQLENCLLVLCAEYIHSPSENGMAGKGKALRTSSPSRKA